MLIYTTEEQNKVYNCQLIFISAKVNILLLFLLWNFSTLCEIIIVRTKTYLVNNSTLAILNVCAQLQTQLAYQHPPSPPLPLR